MSTTFTEGFKRDLLEKAIACRTFAKMKNGKIGLPYDAIGIRRERNAAVLFQDEKQMMLVLEYYLDGNLVATQALPGTSKLRQGYSVRICNLEGLMEVDLA